MLSLFNIHINRSSQLVIPLRFFLNSLGIWVTASFFGLFLSLAAQENAVPPNPLEDLNPSLRPLVRSAAASSWKMDIQDILVRRAEAVSMRWSASKAIKVNATANVGYQVQDTGAEVSDGFKYKFDVYARKPLYTWGSAEADHEYGLLEIERVKQDRQLAFLTIYRDVVNRYIDYTVLQQRVLASQLAEEIIREDVELKRGQVERGEFPATQFATIELDHKREVLKHETLLNSLRRSGDNLRELIGSEKDAPIDVSAGLPAVSSELDTLEARIGTFVTSIDELSVKVGSKRARLDQEMKRLHRYEVNQKPKLNGLLRLRRDSDNVLTGSRQNLEYTEGFAGLEMNWNFYDGKTTTALVIDSLETRRQLERELEDLKTNIEDDLGFHLRDLKIKREQSLLTDQTFAWEQGRYRQVAEDVNAGRSPEKELKAVKRDLERARAVQYDSRGYYYKSLTLLYVMLEYPSILAYLEE